MGAAKDAQPPPDTDKSHLRDSGGWSQRSNSALDFGSLRSVERSCLTHPPPHLTQGLQPLPFSLVCGQGGQLVQLQLGGRGGDVQEVGEGLVDRAGGQPLVLDPVAA